MHMVVGCAGVKVSFVSSSDYMSLRRGDVLTIGELSVYTGAALQVVGIDKEKCDYEGIVCREVLVKTIGLGNKKRLSAMNLSTFMLLALISLILIMVASFLMECAAKSLNEIALSFK